MNKFRIAILIFAILVLLSICTIFATKYVKLETMEHFSNAYTNKNTHNLMTDDAFIIPMLRNGEEQAFKLLFDREYEKLCHFANCMIHDSMTAESIVDDVMFNIWENHKDIVITQSLHAYLVRAVRNRCINELKARLQRLAKETTELKLNAETEMLEVVFRDDSLPIDSLIGEELEEKISKAVEMLPEECRKVMEKSRFEGLSYKEIAAEMGISTNTVKYHIKNALAFLRKNLDGHLKWIIIAILMR